MAGFSALFYDFLMEFINIGPVYIWGWAGGAREWHDMDSIRLVKQAL